MSTDRAPVGPDALADPAQVAEAYGRWVRRGGLADTTKRAYSGEVGAFATWLAGQTKHDPTDVFADSHVRDYAVRDYRRHLLTERKREPKGVDLAVTSLNSLYGWLGLGPATGVRAAAPKRRPDPKALDDEQLRDVLRAAERRGPRDLALVGVGAGTGLRVSELADLDIDDVHVTARTGQVQVRAGKGDKPRKVPLNAQTRGMLEGWLRVRPSWSGSDEPALWVTVDGRRLAVRSIRHTIGEVGKAAGVELNPHMLRHTFGTRLVRAGTDVVVVGGLMGHASIETTRSYARANERDDETAVEGLEVDF